MQSTQTKECGRGTCRHMAAFYSGSLILWYKANSGKLKEPGSDMGVNNKDLKAILREKYAREGYDALTSEERAQLALSYTERPKAAEEAARRLMEEYGGLTAAADSDPYFLMKGCGLSEMSAVLLGLLRETGRLPEDRFPRLTDTALAGAYFISLLGKLPKEQIVIAAADSRLKIKRTAVLAAGTDSGIRFSCRRAAEFALQSDVYCVFVSHNHPAGDTMPSGEDKAATLTLVKAMLLLDVPVADHIIVSSGNYTSMREMLPEIFKGVPDCGYKVKGSAER